ncbi:MAG: hypothetical protein AAF191_07995, partial [Verrucomicrobiota bacterium]
MKRLFSVSSLAGLLVPLAGASATTHDLEWAQKVALSTETVMDGSPDAVVFQWKKAPTVGVFFASPQERALISRTLEKINHALSGTKLGEVRLLSDREKDRAQVKVYFGKLRE